MALADILKGNPFTEDVVERWKRELAEFNDGKRKRTDLDFTLEADREWIESVDQGKKNRVYRELLPVPFQGSPTAPVWLILMNPGYSAVDLYDNLGLCPGCGRSLSKSSCQANPSHAGGCILEDSCRDDVRTQLERRQAILLNQLRLRGECSFPFLDEAFNTLGETALYKGKGGYRWWTRHVAGRTGFLHGCAGDAKRAGSRLFVLETFPYHSLHFSDICYSQESFTESAYFSFWVRLVRWGIENGKMFILRPGGEFFMSRVRRAGLDIEAMKRLYFKQTRNVYVTPNNLFGDEETCDQFRCVMETAVE